MDTSLNEFPWATAMIFIVGVVVVLVGGAVVIWGTPGTLSFNDYLNDLKNFAVAVGLLGIGRGIRAHSKLAATHRR